MEKQPQQPYEICLRDHFTPGKAGKTDSDCVNDPVTEAAEQLENSFDEVFGGFGNAPKFPVPHNLLFLMLYAEKKKLS